MMRNRVSKIRHVWKLLPCLLAMGGAVPLYVQAEGVTAIAPPAVYPATTWQGRAAGTVRVMRRLDSHVELVPLKVGEEVQYGTLTLKLGRCLQRPETLPAESVAQLHIEERQEAGSPPFDGWMFTNDPALGVYAGGLYDVRLVSCGGDKVEPMVGPLPKPVSPSVSGAVGQHVEADENHAAVGSDGAYNERASAPHEAPLGSQHNGKADSDGGSGPLSLLPPPTATPPAAPAGPTQP